VIATVIIVAITIAIAVAVIGWLTGLWNGITGSAGALKIYSDSYINATASPPVLYLHLKNTGSGKVTIYKIAVGGFSGYVTGFSPSTTLSSAGQVYISSATPSNGCFVSDGKIIVKANSECTLYIALNSNWNFAPSGTYSVVFYTYEAGPVKANVIVH